MRRRAGLISSYVLFDDKRMSNPLTMLNLAVEFTFPASVIIFCNFAHNDYNGHVEHLNQKD